VFAPDEMWLYRSEVGAVESYAAFPPLAYVIAAALLPLFNGVFWGARALSLISYVGTVLMTFLLGRRLLPEHRRIALPAALVVAFLPQVSFTGSYFNNDAFALFESSVLIYLLLVAWERPRLSVFAVIGFLLGALVLTKYSFYAVAGVGLLAGLHLSRLGRSPNACRLSLLASGLLICGWWFLRNWQLYGEAIPGRVIAAAKEAAGGNTLPVAADQGVNLLTLSFTTDFWPLTVKSLVAGFGFQTVFLEPAYYAACGLAALVGVAGVVRRLVPGGLSSRALAAALVGGAMLLGTLASAMAINVYGEWSPQGRYLFGGLIPLVVGVVAGWHFLTSGLRHFRWLLWTPVLGMVVLNGISLVRWVVPAYFGDDPQHIILHVDSPAGFQSAGSETTIAGWALLEAASSWEPFSPVAVSGYRLPVDHVVVYVDGPPGVGAPLGRALYGVRRKDVADYYGKIRELERVGYELVAPPRSLPPGKHTLYVCAYVMREIEPACRERALQIL
jgi:4-amino-4-deoxy-L-arabinose transferase-like glycosyltransferase